MYKSLDDIITIYGVEEYDWLNFKITKENKLTYHHLLKRQNGGRHGIDNGAPLTTLGHNYLHQIEARDYEIYIKLNNILKRINTSGTAPTNDDIKLIEQLFLEFETKHYEELNQRNIKINFNKIRIQEIIENNESLKLYKTAGECIIDPTALRKIMQQGVVIKVPREKVKKKGAKKKHKKKKKNRR